MSTSKKLVDGRFLKLLVLINGLVPGVLLAWDAYQGALGVNEVNFAIRTTGILGLIFLVLSLAITPLRRLTGWNTLIAPRRQLGLLGFFYIAAHFIIFWLYDRDGSIADTFAEIVARVYLWFGFGALALMIPLAITSTDGMVARLGKRWKSLHRLAYVAIPAGVVHYYLLQKSDTRLATIVGVLVGVLLLARLIPKRKPAAKKRTFWSGELRVEKIIPETHDVKTFRFAMLDGSPIPFQAIAGQYLNIALMIDGKRVNRSYTIAAAPGRCEITVKRIGLASQHLHDQVKEGDVLRIGAPAGKFHFSPSGRAGAGAGDRVTLVAGGVGITPMMSVIRSLTARNWKGDIYLLFSVRKPEDVIFKDELAGLAARFPNLHVEIIVTSLVGHITKDIVAKTIPDVRGPVMLCGPEPMMDAMRAIFVELGVPDAQITQEEFVSPLAVVDTSPSTLDVAPVANAKLSFRKAGKSGDASELTVLEVAEECGVDIPYECRSGICGQCKTPLVAGRVVMDVQDALTAADKSKGLILACQARATTDEVIVDA